MFEKKADVDVWFVPWHDVDPDEAVRLGASWLRDQTGPHLVLLHQKNMYNNNRLLPRLTSGAHVEKPSTVWSWEEGAVLAPWPSEQVLGVISSFFARGATSACILRWGDKAYVDAWLIAHEARNLLTGDTYRGVQGEPLLSPVVVVAMRHLGNMVNHNNALVSSFEKAYAVRTLQELWRSGHRFDVDNICAWALANGFTDIEVRYLREYANKIVAGRGFRLQEPVGPERGEAANWEAEVAAELKP